MKYIKGNSNFTSRFKWKNDGFRSLYESAIHSYITKCLDDFKKNDTTNNVLIGALALSYYLKPRQTQDVDLIFLSEDDTPKSVNGFKKIRKHAFMHLETHVEVEILTPEFLNINKNTVKEVFERSKIVDGIKVACPVSLIALKLIRFSLKDRTDIIELVQYCNENNIEIELSKFDLSKEYLDNFNSLEIIEEKNENMYFLESSFSLKNNKYEKIENNDFDIYVFNEEFGEPRFHVFSKDKNVRYCLDLKTLEIVDSSTDYKSFLMNEDLETSVNKYISKNIKKIKEIWNKLNF